MKKIISGLLVITLLSGPFLIKVDFIGYQGNTSHFTPTALEYQIQNPKIVGTADVDSIMTTIEKNNHEINVLAKKVHTVTGSIQAAMSMRAQTKVAMSEEQIISYQEFATIQESARNSLTLASYQTEYGNQLKKVQQEIMRNDSDLEAIFDELSIINESQSNVMDTLNSIICGGERTLAVI